MTADRVWTRADMADAFDRIDETRSVGAALVDMGLCLSASIDARAAYYRASRSGETVRAGCLLSVQEADAMLDAIARAGGKVSKGDGGAWTVEVLVAALNATGRNGFSSAANALFGVGDAGGGLGFGPLRDKISFAYCANPHPDGPMHSIGLVSVIHGDLAAVCEVLNAERVPLPSGPRSAGGTATIASVDPNHERHVAMILAARKRDAPKVDPYDAFAVNALNTAGRGELGSVGETTRAGAEAHARLRLADARSCAANLARDIAELERALAEHGREGKDGAR